MMIGTRSLGAFRGLREIRNMIRPEPKREPLPPLKRYEPPVVDDTADAVR